jgi:hypothetical protein
MGTRSRDNVLSPHKLSLMGFYLLSSFTLALGLASHRPAFSAESESPLTSAENTVVSSIFDPQSTPAWAVHELSILVLMICAGIFIVVAGLTIYTIIRFRQPKDDDGREPPQVYGSNQIELAWTVIPILIVLILFLVSARTIYEVEGKKPPANALHVTIVGHQWWWEIKYPELGFVTANEVHVPVSDPQDPSHLPQAGIRRRDPQLLDAAPGWKSGRRSESHQPHVD